jgi:hypothetical protein
MGEAITLIARSYFLNICDRLPFFTFLDRFPLLLYSLLEFLSEAECIKDSYSPYPGDILGAQDVACLQA